MTSDLFKCVIAFLLSSFIPFTIAAFLLVRRTKKQVEFDRVVHILDISATEGEFARDRVAEQYATNNYWLPVLYAWFMSGVGFIALLFGADLVIDHPGKANFLLTGMLRGKEDVLQAQRYQGMLVLSVSFCGGFLWSAQNILRRLNAGDLTPMVYFSAGTRMTIAPVLALMLSYVLAPPGTSENVIFVLPAIAFLVGFFPDSALQYLKEKLLPMFATAATLSGGGRTADELPLSMIEGIDVYDRARLDEIGIQDAQNLANANLIELVVRTSLNPNQIIDWIAQAKLYVYFKDDIKQLRKSQIRSMFDMLPATENDQYLQDIASATGLQAVNLRHYTTVLARDPSARRLLAFHQRLCAPPKTLDAPAQIETPPLLPVALDVARLTMIGVLLLAGCAAPLAPVTTTSAPECGTRPDVCLSAGRTQFEAYRQAKLDLIRARSDGYRLPSAPIALLYPQRTKYSALLIHGLNDSAFYMGDLAEVLYASGINVITILLPGHGTDKADMRSVTADQWRSEVETGLGMAALVGEHVLVGGMSLGGALAIDAAVRRSDISGLLLFVPALELRSYGELAWITCAPLIDEIAAETEVTESPVKYRDRVANGVCQLERIMAHNASVADATVDIKTGSSRMAALGTLIRVPTFIGLTYLDARVSPCAILKFSEAIRAPTTVATYGPPSDCVPRHCRTASASWRLNQRACATPISCAAPTRTTANSTPTSIGWQPR